VAIVGWSRLSRFNIRVIPIKTRRGHRLDPSCQCSSRARTHCNVSRQITCAAGECLNCEQPIYCTPSSCSVIQCMLKVKGNYQPSRNNLPRRSIEIQSSSITFLATLALNLTQELLFFGAAEARLRSRDSYIRSFLTASVDPNGEQAIVKGCNFTPNLSNN